MGVIEKIALIWGILALIVAGILLYLTIQSTNRWNDFVRHSTNDRGYFDSDLAEEWKRANK